MSITACFHYNTDSWVDVTSFNFNSKKSTKITFSADKIYYKFSADKIYYNFSQEYPKITNM